DDFSKEFRYNIRQYNAAHAFTSLGAKIDQSVFDGYGPYSLHICRELYHRMGSLLPDLDAKATYAQLYIYDLEIAYQLRIERNESLSPNIIQSPENQSNIPRLTQLEFYTFRLFPWHNKFSTILHDEKLFQEFIVDTWAV
ncbi:7518_t:CDS:2, partial [Dentiscutata heterogama]